MGFDRASLIGKRVVIQAFKPYGSARLLDGLKGTVVRMHHIAGDWAIVQLDPNPVTPHEEWPIPIDRLVECDESCLPDRKV